MKIFIIIFFITTLFSFQQSNPRSEVPQDHKTIFVPIKKNVYDPDKLPNYEIACGRDGAHNSAPCHCVKERIRIQEELYAKCELVPRSLLDKTAYKDCLRNVPECKDIKVLDVDSWNNNKYSNPETNPVAPFCKRSCSQARCECCKS